MLKLEKLSNALGLTLRLRERENFFNPQLLKALAIALFLHLGGLLLFHVSPFQFSSSFVFPPIQVQSDHALSHAISTKITLNAPEQEEFPFPPLRLLPPAIDWIHMPLESSLEPSLALNLNTLQYREENVWPIWHSPLSIPLEEPLIQLTIAGDLAEYPLQSSDPKLNQMHRLSEDSPLYHEVIFQVQLDGRKGEIFWYERVHSSGNKKMDRLAEQMLLSLRFASPKTKEFVSGKLHFAISDLVDKTTNDLNDRNDLNDKDKRH